MFDPTRREAALGLAAAAGPVHADVAGPEPRRIVSLNPCIDVILVNVADRAQIAAISHYSHEPTSSSIGPAALSYPFTYESAEEVLALRPDLVLTGRHSSPATRSALAQLGVRTELFGVAESVAQSVKEVRRVGRLTHRTARAEAVVARIEAALQAAAPPPGARRPSALVFRSDGLVTAKGTLMDELMTRCGFDNVAPRYGLKRTARLPLEQLIADPPDVLLAGEGRPGAPNWAGRVIHHPALAQVAGRMRRAVFPERLGWCGGPVIVEAAAFLARARQEALGGRA